VIGEIPLIVEAGGESFVACDEVFG